MLTRRTFLTLPAAASVAGLPLAAASDTKTFPLLQAKAGKARLAPVDYPERVRPILDLRLKTNEA